MSSITSRAFARSVTKMAGLHIVSGVVMSCTASRMIMTIIVVHRSLIRRSFGDSDATLDYSVVNPISAIRAGKSALFLDVIIIIYIICGS